MPIGAVPDVAPGEASSPLVSPGALKPVRAGVQVASTPLR